MIIAMVVAIGVVPFAVLFASQMFEDKPEQIPFSKESCESFKEPESYGVWVEDELTCYNIEIEDCAKMGGQYETFETFYWELEKKCTLDDYKN